MKSIHLGNEKISNQLASSITFALKKMGKSLEIRRYYISNLDNNAEVLAEAIRGHWGIENQLNWVLDVQFQEDDSRIRKDNAPENFAIIRQIALNLLNQEKTVKTGIKNKRNRAGWNNNYLLKVLFSP